MELINHINPGNQNRRFYLWKAQSRPVIAFENRFFLTLRKYFRKQEKTVLGNLNRIAHRLPKPSKSIKATIAELIDLIIFDFDTEVEELIKAAKPHMTGMSVYAGRQAMETVITGLSFDETNIGFLKAVDKKIVKFAKDVNETTLARMVPRVKEVLREGGNVEQVREAIQGVFAGSVRGTAPRARLIARTEMVGSSTLGNLEAYKQSGVVSGKEWLSTKDDRVRDTHNDIDGKVISLDDNFQVGGATLAGPGLFIAGDVGEIMNCRCVSLPARLPKKGGTGIEH